MVFRLVAVFVLLAGPTSAAEIFNRHTMLGWTRQSDPGLIAYAELPIHGASRADRPRAGFALTAPTRSRIGDFRPIIDAPRTFDLRYSRAGFGSRGHWSLRSERAVAWSTDPAEVPGGHDRLLGGSGSWIAVGLLTAGAIAGVFLITEDDVPPPATTR
jgi:hypothetical protein